MKNKIEVFEIILRSVRSLFMSFAIVVLLASFFSFGGGDAVHAMSVSYIWQLFAICFGVNFTQFFLSFINFNSFALATSAYFADTLAVVYLLSWLFGFLDGTFKIFLMVFVMAGMPFICVLLFVYYHDYREANAINDIIKKNKDLLV